MAVLTEPDEDIFNLAREGVIDAVQLHGDLFVETNYLDANFLWYRCVNISDVRDFPESCAARMLLLDSKSEAKGGSGIRIEDDVLYSIAEKYGKRLRIAGGINAENAAEVAEKFHTQMIDISSGVEEFAGKKSREKMQKLFSSLERYRRGL